MAVNFYDSRGLKTQLNEVMNVKQIYYISLLKMFILLDKESFISK